jgi:hypothetical protein
MFNRVTAETYRMLHEAGFEAAFVRDITEGATVMINHRINREALTEMQVRNLRVGIPDDTGNRISTWIGVTSEGFPIHCMYGSDWECFIKRPDEGDAS